MKKILMVICFLAACGDPHHGIELSDTYKVYNQDKAMLITEARFEDHYGIQSNAFREAVVYWTDTKCPYHDDWTVVCNDKCYYGVMWACDDMYVAMNKYDLDQLTCRTALLHEFGHCLLISAGMDGDRNHTNNEFWDLIAAAKRETCDRGW